MRTSKANLLVRCAAAALSLPLAAAPADAQLAWNALPPISTPRNVFTLTTLADGRLLVAGGWNGTEQASCEIYDPATRTWSAT